MYQHESGVGRYTLNLFIFVMLRLEPRATCTVAKALLLRSVPSLLYSLVMFSPCTVPSLHNDANHWTGGHESSEGCLRRVPALTAVFIALIADAEAMELSCREVPLYVSP